MELYTLDTQMRAINVIDVFESLIWTERWADVGDFELDIAYTPQIKAMLTTGTNLAMTDSYRVMTVKQVQDAIADDGTHMLKVTGKSLEDILDDRLFTQTMAGSNLLLSWILQNKSAADAMRYAFEFSCVDGGIHPLDVLPNYVTGNLFPADTIPEDPSYIYRADMKIESVLAFLKDISGTYDIGFRLYRNPATGQLLFNVYMGSDRTTGQSTLPAVIFSPDLDNLGSPTELATIEGYKNVCYVVGAVYDTNASGDTFPEVIVVYAPGVDPTVTGFARRSMVLDLSSEDFTGFDHPGVEAETRGLIELAKVRPQTALDGEVTQYSPYKYGVHYFLGDKVTERNTDGLTYNMRVTEQIFASDSNGERSYPTLSVLELASGGS